MKANRRSANASEFYICYETKNRGETLLCVTRI